MRRYTLSIVVAALLSHIVVFTPTALADLGFYIGPSNYPGSNCQPSNGSQAQDYYLSSTGIKNISSSDRWITCPIPNNYIPNGMDEVVLSVRGPHQSTPSKILCLVINNDKNGFFLSYNAMYINSWGDAIMEQLATNTTNGVIYQTLQCRLPAQSELLWYYPNHN